jgi:hypothetical protein
MFSIVPCPICAAAATLPWVNQLTDQQLLLDYAERRSEAAFAELVRRRIDLIYSATLRVVQRAVAFQSRNRSGAH